MGTNVYTEAGPGCHRWLQEQREDTGKSRKQRAGTAMSDKQLQNSTPESRARAVPEEQRRLMGCAGGLTLELALEAKELVYVERR